MQLIDVEQSKASLSDLLDAAVSGQEIILTRNAQPIAKIVALLHEHLPPRFGSARGLDQLVVSAFHRSSEIV